jgi:thiol-disulfide isomerase/thioredoxin
MKKLVFIFLVIFTLTPLLMSQTPALKLEGQVVCCEDCWAEKDRTKFEYGNAEDLLKAKSCVEGGDPTLLAVREGDKFKLYQLEQGKFRLSEKNWLSYVGKKVAVTGTVRQNKKQSIFRVDALEVLEKSLAERESAQVLGTEVELKLRDLFGAEQSLAQYKGRIVILNFWATYCVPCRKEMPDLSAIQNEFAALGVQVIGASTDEAKDRDKVLQFIKELKINFPIWMGATAEDTLRFGVGTALPATVIIGKDGKIVKTISGIINPAELRRDIEKLLQDAETQAKTENREKVKVSETEVSSVPS